ncbi:unnamed protein product [Orchesella dallaii]|uniref:JmjC domain-containing protein n=1 Tax=Orchesella dallaii TaxID=48710 RepID=A0ABP1R3S5_9HEXA
MKKLGGDFHTSAKHYRLALADQATSTLSPFEIRFHIAHLHEIYEKPKLAKGFYEQLLKEKDLPSQLRADVHRHIGWMYHVVDALGEKQQREPIAIHFLQKSLEAEPRSGQTLYLLGRCFASIGRVHDAFLAYRNSVDKSEGNADTWCSIGVLYQQQNQPLDALQAYICAVQLDKFHVAAWTNLGILYESVSQPKDALACFVNASRGFYSVKNKKPMNPSLVQRIQFLQSRLANAPSASAGTKPRQLPVIEEAWNLPISAEMTARQQQQQQAQRQAMYAQQQKGSGSVPNAQYSGNGVGQNGVPATKRFKAEEPVHGTSPQVVPRNPATSVCLSQQQLHNLQVLQQSVQQGQQLTPSQQQYLAQLQHQYRLMQQHQQSSNRSSVSSFPSTASPRPASSPCHVQSAQPDLSNSQAQGFSSGGSDFSHGNQNQDSLDRSTPKSTGAVSTSPPFSPNVSDQELQAWLSQKDLGDDLLKNVDLDDLDLMDEDELTGSNNNSLHSINNNNILEEKSNSNRTLRAEVDQKISIPSPRTMSSPVDSEQTLHIGLTAKELKERCKGLGLKGVTNCSILGDKVPPPAPPETPKMKLNEEQLNPQAPSVLVESKTWAFSPSLQEFCLQHPIAVVRGIAAALKLDLGLFSTKTLVEANPDHAVEVRAQYLQSADENHDTTGKKVWGCYSHRSQTTIAKYASYQASSFQDSVKEENDKSQGIQNNSDSDSKDSLGNPKKKKKMLKFGTNVDLSDDRKWRDQLQELNKLPAFARVVSAGNMLSHVGHVILGMNTVQLYMKVPGSRTPGHQENNNFCSININIGPGDCEWFAVPDAYWGAIQNLCEQNNLSYLHGSWWPDLKDCAKAGIPVYRFTQKPGDLVWVNSGCVHWVQAIGWCNNIAWNVGPLTARQYQLGIDRYEWNKLQHFKSIVPMIHLSWNLARNIRVSDAKLFELIKSTLMRTLLQCFKLLEFARSKNVEVRFHGRQKNDASHYCGQCELEVFNILFIREQERRHVVHCVDCARKASPNLQGFMCLEEYKLDELMEVYDNFVLHKATAPIVPPVQLPLPPLPPPPPIVQQVAPISHQSEAASSTPITSSSL